MFKIAVELAKDGARVFLVGRSEDKLRVTADKILAEGGTEPIIFPCDVTDKEAVKSWHVPSALFPWCSPPPS